MVKTGALNAQASIGLSISGFGLSFGPGPGWIIRALERRYGHFAERPPGTGKGPRCSFKAAEYEGKALPFRPAVSLRDGLLSARRGDFRFALELRSGEGELEAAPREQTLDAFLRSLISALLLRSGGMMLHSAGLVKGGRAYLFLGRSGAGKSTLSKLARAAGAEVVSDEINMVRREGAGFFAYGSPFWGEMRAEGRPGRWPLGGVFLLKKSRGNAIAPCGAGEALGALLRCLLNFERGPAVSGLVMANAAALLETAAFRRLEFSKANADFLKLI